MGLLILAFLLRGLPLAVCSASTVATPLPGRREALLAAAMLSIVASPLYLLFLRGLTGLLVSRLNLAIRGEVAVVAMWSGLLAITCFVLRAVVDIALVSYLVGPGGSETSRALLELDLPLLSVGSMFVGVQIGAQTWLMSRGEALSRWLLRVGWPIAGLDVLAIVAIPGRACLAPSLPGILLISLVLTVGWLFAATLALLSAAH